MKTLNKINRFLIFLIVVVAIVATSCKKEEIDPPHFVMPTYTLSAGDTLLTIAQLKAMHPATVDTKDSIKSNYFIKGIITGNDESGNIYKTLYIQDATGGIILSLDAKDMFNKFKVGQEIYVKCKNLVYGIPYGGGIQLGAIYNGAPGRLAEAEIAKHLFKNGWSGSTPEPKIITGAADLTFDKAFMLVRMDSVTFAEAGQTYYTASSDIGGATNRTITLKDGTTVIVRTSSFATFKDVLMPTGKGSIIAVLGYYNGFQLLLRNTNDVFGFSSK
ncbi:MAG: DUF5689 domain-containing protein [Bacteroidales bacterium]